MNKVKDPIKMTINPAHCSNPVGFICQVNDHAASGDHRIVCQCDKDTMETTGYRKALKAYMEGGVIVIELEDEWTAQKRK